MSSFTPLTRNEGVNEKFPMNNTEGNEIKLIFSLI